MHPLLLLICITATLFKTYMSQSINCANPADVMFLIDGSDSINQQEWNQERNFVARMIQALDISPSTINVGFTVYSSSIDRHLGLTPFRPKIVLNAMAKMLDHPTGIATNTAAGIKRVHDEFRNQPASRSNAPKIMIVITDGSSENPAETIRQAELAKADGIRIIAVGVGNNVFLEELQEIATNQQKLYRAPDFAALRGIESDIRNMICRVITTTMSPRFTFRPPTPPPEFIPIGGDRLCNNPADIVFVVDGSDSINDADFVRLKTFVANLIDNFEISADAIHVGIIVYSTLIGEKVGLYPPKNKFVLKALANNLEHPKFGTDTAAGIQAAREMISQQGRPDAPEMIVVITDGRSTNPRNTIIQASIAKAQGITMIAIGVGQDIFSEELNEIASSPQSKYVSRVADFRALSNTVNAMRDLICTSITTQAISTTTMMPPTPPPYIPPPADGLICNVPGDVIFILDGSDSIQPNDWIRQRNFVNNLINNLEVGQPYIHVAVVVYSSTIGEVIPLIPYKSKPVLNMLVANLTQPRFGTDTALGIQKGREILKLQGRRTNAPKVIIVVTDGKSTFPDNTMIQANMAKADGYTVISVGIGADIYSDELVDIASSPSQFFKVIDFASLSNIIAELRDRICQVVQTTTEAPSTTTLPTTTTTEMTTPFTVPLMPCVESRTEADLVFLIDGQKNISPYSWMMETHFVSNFLDGFEIRPEFVHVGVVISDHVRGDEIGISPFKSRMHMKELIHGLMRPSGDMDTAAGLRAVQDIFRNQGRRNAEKVMVFVTDGSSRSMAETNMEANRLKSLGVEVVTVGVGNQVNLAELTQMATNPALTLRTQNFDQFFGLLPRLQNVVCELLRKPETTTMQTTTPSPGLCDGCLIDQGVGFNPYPGDCTKFVQCWKQGETIMSLVRSCPFGQFWDADAITCRPSFLVFCTADPCKQSTPGFTYGMKEYGCRAYWKCIDGFSVGHCCPRGSAYVEGMGCIESTYCTEECPPSGGIAVKPMCDKKPHWDKRYYIEIVYGRGEIVRPCPAGTIFFEEKCACDFGLSGLLPTTPDVLCQPSAFFPFDQNLHDQSLNRINVGLTNMRLTDLGTAYFNGHSEMNLWRFAGTDWGNHLVIKFKFRFDYSNKFIDYGGLPVDLGIDFDVNMNLISDYHMTDMDWRLWNQLRKVRTLDDWRQLLREFGQSRTFYIFLGTLGFKPGTSNSLQVVRILGTPEAYRAFQAVLNRMRPETLNGVNLNEKSSAGLKGILQQLRGMRGLINWDYIIAQLKGESGSGSDGSTGSGTTVVETVNVNGENVPKPGTGQWRWDGISGQWIKVTGSSSGIGAIGTGTMTGTNENVLNIGGTDAASEWRWNSVTGQWERLAAAHTPGGSTSSADVQIINEMSGGSSGGSVGSWQWEAAGSKVPITGTGAHLNMSQTVTGMGGMTWNDIMRELARMQNTTSGTWQWSTVGGSKSGSVEANRQAIESLLNQLKLTGGQSGSASWNWNISGASSSSQGASQDANRQAIEALLAQLQQGSNGGSSSWQWNMSGGSASGENNAGSQAANIQAIESLLAQLKMSRGLGGSSSGKWSASGGSVDLTSEITSGGQAENIKAIESLLAQLKMAGGKGGSTSWQWTSSGGTAAGQELDMAKLNSILKQMQEMGKSSAGGSINTSGTFVTSGGQAAVITGGMGNNAGVTGGKTGSKRTIQIRQETQQPLITETITGGRVVGGAFGGAGSGSVSTGTGQQSGSVVVQETSSRRGDLGQVGGQVGEQGIVQGSGQFETRFTARDSRPSTSNSGTVVSIVKQTVAGEAGPSIPDRSAPRGAEARGVRKQDEGRIVGISVPAESEFVSGATVIGRGEKTVRVTNTQPEIRINEIVQEVSPTMFETTGGFARGGTSGSGSTSWQTSASGQVDGSFGAASGGSSTSSGGSGQFVGRRIITDATGMAGGDFTQMGKVVGSGGGVKRVIDTNVKRMPAGEVQFNADGGVSLASLGLGGAEGANIIRQTVRVEPVGNGKFVGAGGQFQSTLSGSSSGGSQGFMSSNSINQGSSGSGQGGTFSASGSFSGSSGSSGIFDMNALNRGAGGQMSAQQNSNLFPLLPVLADSAENIMEGIGGKRKRRSTRKSRAKRAINKQNYQALVTNCQGQDGQGPSIMVVANQGDVQFALKTYNQDPAVISVPAVEGWNDVTLIYDGRALTGVVENWKGLHKASVSLQGNVERRQAGLLVGSCQGFASFHGEIDDLSVYKCLTPAIEELRDRIVL